MALWRVDLEFDELSVGVLGWHAPVVFVGEQIGCVGGLCLGVEEFEAFEWDEGRVDVAAGPAQADEVFAEHDDVVGEAGGL